MKDTREGNRARWSCDALHSIMLMKRIIMSPPQAVEADRAWAQVCFTFDGVICVHGSLCVFVYIIKQKRET